MSENQIEQGKHWVMEVFEQVRTEYREKVSVGNVFPWRGGHTFEESREEQGPSGFSTYYLPFEVGQDMHYISFTRQELDECSNLDNSEARFAVKKKILGTFESLESD